MMRKSAVIDPFNTILIEKNMRRERKEAVATSLDYQNNTISSLKDELLKLKNK